VEFVVGEKYLVRGASNAGSRPRLSGAYSSDTNARFLSIEELCAQLDELRLL